MECDRSRNITYTFIPNFNPRTHMECDRSPTAWVSSFWLISIHALTWSATLKRTSVRTQVSYFNPRTHMECDPRILSHCTKTHEFQSTHSHGVRPLTLTEMEQKLGISIHALTWSATVCRSFPSGLRKIFQSTHSHGVRPWHGLYLRIRKRHFNPRTHMECDRRMSNNSIAFETFQSTHSHGVRRVIGESKTVDLSFQSTHSHGVRPFTAFFVYISAVNFNPRTHMECDLISSVLPFACSFQSTHSHGVRHAPNAKIKAEQLFQSTHSHGVRRSII